MTKISLLSLFLLLSGVAQAAQESFESKVIRKEIQEIYGNGTLSASSEVYNIVVLNKAKKQYLKIELSKESFEALHVGDLVKIILELGWFDAITVKEIKLLQAVAPPTN
jgi:hypothetical protein